LTRQPVFANLCPNEENRFPATTTPWAAWASASNLQRLQALLSQIHWIAQEPSSAAPGSPTRGRKVKKGPYYLWTCKVRGRTFCLALSKPQYQLLSKAIDNNRTLQKTFKECRHYLKPFSEKCRGQEA